jgi:hypothetical protein
VKFDSSVRIYYDMLVKNISFQLKILNRLSFDAAKGKNEQIKTPSPHVPSPVNGRWENPDIFYNPFSIMQIWTFPSLFKRGDQGVS